MFSLFTGEILAVILLVIIMAVVWLSRRLGVPYTVALVIAGLLLTFQRSFHFGLTPEVILLLFVPPLVFDGAFRLDLRLLRDEAVVVGLLALVGVLVSMVVVGSILWIAGIESDLAVAMVFGAVVAPTDPVAVVALFRALGVPKRVQVLLEGESLFNDGLAIVLFTIVVALVPASSSLASGGVVGFRLGSAILRFLGVALGGLGVGAALGLLASLILRRLDDYLLESTLTTVLAFGAYLAADALGVSGVLATVSAGLLTGTYGRQGMSRTTRAVLTSVWEFIAFLANSVLFLLIGFAVRPDILAANLVPAGIAIVALFAARAIVIYGLLGLYNVVTNHVVRIGLAIPRTFQHVLFWGGLRGAVALALVLSLPGVLQYEARLHVMTFAVVLFTVVVQGTTMRTLLARLGLAGAEPEQDDSEAKAGAR